MKVKLKEGKGTIANAIFEISPGRVVEIADSHYDPETMDIVEVGMPAPTPEPKEDLDLNKDGIVDKKDASIAGKVMNKAKGKMSKKVKRK
jgi:hypothetical protein